MLKTIKTTKQLRLDELIKYIFEENIKADKNLIKYRSKFDTLVEVDMSGQIAVYGRHFGNELYTVEVEEKITEDTIFQELYSVYYSSEKSFRDIYSNASINDIILEDSKRGIETERIYALYKGKIELIGERDKQ